MRLNKHEVGKHEIEHDIEKHDIENSITHTLDVRSTGPRTPALGMVTPVQPFDLSPSGA